MYSHSHLLRLTALLAESEGDTIEDSITDHANNNHRPQSPPTRSINDGEEEKISDVIQTFSAPFISSRPNHYLTVRRSAAELRSSLESRLLSRSLSDAEILNQQREKILEDNIVKKLLKSSKNALMNNLSHTNIENEEQPQPSFIVYNENILSPTKQRELRERNKQLSEIRLMNKIELQRAKFVSDQEKNQKLLISNQQQELKKLEDLKLSRNSSMKHREKLINNRESSYHFLTLTNHIAKQQRLSQEKQIKEKLLQENSSSVKFTQQIKDARMLEISTILRANEERIRAQNWIEREARRAMILHQAKAQREQ